jgi:hypothetical protein
MNNSERARLMHTVLDGEATEAEARELERLLAAEPAARTEFEHLRQLFDGLSRVPKAFPPEGLVAAVMANIPQNSPSQGRPDQLSLRSRVIGLAWMKARGTSPGKSATDLPAHQPGIYLREWKMSEQSSNLSRKRNVLIGGGIAIAAALFALSYTIDFPAGVQNTVGTIVPAQRYHAPQPTADQIKVGPQSGTPSAQAVVESQAVHNALQGSTDKVMQGGVDKVTNSAADKVTNSAADKVTNSAADKVTNSAADKVTNSAADKVTNSAADKVTNSSVDKVTNSSVDKVTNSSVDKVTNSAADKAMNNAADKAMNSAADKATNAIIK